MKMTKVLMLIVLVAFTGRMLGDLKGDLKKAAEKKSLDDDTVREWKKAVNALFAKEDPEIVDAKKLAELFDLMRAVKLSNARAALNVSVQKLKENEKYSELVKSLPEKEEAAITIQKMFRGMKERQELALLEAKKAEDFGKLMERLQAIAKQYPKYDAFSQGGKDDLDTNFGNIFGWLVDQKDIKAEQWKDIEVLISPISKQFSDNKELSGYIEKMNKSFAEAAAPKIGGEETVTPVVPVVDTAKAKAAIIARISFIEKQIAATPTMTVKEKAKLREELRNLKKIA